MPKVNMYDRVLACNMTIFERVFPCVTMYARVLSRMPMKARVLLFVTIHVRILTCLPMFACVLYCRTSPFVIMYCDLVLHNVFTTTHCDARQYTNIHHFANNCNTRAFMFIHDNFQASMIHGNTGSPMVLNWLFDAFHCSSMHMNLSIYPTHVQSCFISDHFTSPSSL